MTVGADLLSRTPVEAVAPPEASKDTKARAGETAASRHEGQDGEMIHASCYHPPKGGGQREM